jgi:cystathionine beta-lyase/cystathionine gamma-synthase
MSHRFDTDLIHAGEITPRPDGAVVMPIFQSATFEYGGEGSSYHDLKYIRLNNTPNHRVLHAKLAALEGGEAALVTASGMAAISAALLAILKPGDHVLVQESLYGGTHDFVHGDLLELGIAVTTIDPAAASTWAAKATPKTRAVYVETISNPLMRVPDLAAVVEFARSRQIVSLIDNTFASPLVYPAAQMGFDLSLHSGTKYLNGHSDIVAGAVIGRADLVMKVRHKLNHLGGALDPHACFLLHRGLKTLGVRMRHQMVSAMKIARFLEEQPAVAAVNYPGLPRHPHHALAKRDLKGFGAMLSFELKAGAAAAAALMTRLKLPICAPSLGGVESLVTRPATTSHSGMSAEARRKMGVSDGLIRYSVGCEDQDDLIEDLDAALRESGGTGR